DQDIIAQIYLRVRDLYQKQGGKFPDPVLHATWAYTDPQHPSLSEVAKEINGKALADLKDEKTHQVIKAGQQLPGFAWLNEDGTEVALIWEVEGGGDNGVGQVVMLRVLCRGWHAARPPRTRRSVRPGHLSKLGMVVAGESPNPLQPGLLRPRRQALGSFP